jgi:hypothetical protein
MKKKTENNNDRLIDHPLHLMVLFFSFLLIVYISIDTFHGVVYYRQVEFLDFQCWVCLLFLLDFFWEWRKAPRKWHYLRTHFLFLLVSIPYLTILRLTHWELPNDWSYLIRFAPLVRGGYALALLVGSFTSSRTTTLFYSYLTILASAIYFVSLVFYNAELHVNPDLHSYPEALWWACMDVTTIGSNIIAVTPVGRLVSFLLVAMGVMMFPIFTVFITHEVERRKRKERKKSEEKEPAA